MKLQVREESEREIETRMDVGITPMDQGSVLMPVRRVEMEGESNGGPNLRRSYRKFHRRRKWWWGHG
jgi:hypothetical protein